MYSLFLDLFLKHCNSVVSQFRINIVHPSLHLSKYLSLHPLLQPSRLSCILTVMRYLASNIMSGTEPMSSLRMQCVHVSFVYCACNGLLAEAEWQGIREY